VKVVAQAAPVKEQAPAPIAKSGVEVAPKKADEKKAPAPAKQEAPKKKEEPKSAPKKAEQTPKKQVEAAKPAVVAEQPKVAAKSDATGFETVTETKRNKKSGSK